MQLAIRDAFVGYLKPLFDLQYPSVPLALPNQPFDWNAPPETFMQLEVSFFGGDQVGVELNPRRRVRGMVYLTHYTREGQGTREALAAMDWFSNVVKFALIGGANFQAPEPAGDDRRRGFYTESVKVPFFSVPG